MTARRKMVALYLLLISCAGLTLRTTVKEWELIHRSLPPIDALPLSPSTHHVAILVPILLPSSAQSTGVELKKTIPTIFTDLFGGLGNQIWIFLSSQGIARTNAARAAYSIDAIQMMKAVFALHQQRDFDVVNATAFPNVRKWDEFDADRYRPITIDRDTHLHMFLQNPKYLADVPDIFAADIFAHEAKQHLPFQPAILREAQELLDGLAGNTRSCINHGGHGGMATAIVKSWIGIHVRRFPDRHKSEPLPRDRFLAAQINRVVQRCQKEQQGLLSAVDRTNITSSSLCKTSSNSSSRLSSCCVLVLSNDPQWAKQHVRPSNNGCIQFVENDLLEDPALKGRTERQNAWATHSGRDLAALTLCDYLIVTVGSFGYFAGMLHSGQRKQAGNDEADTNIAAVAAANRQVYAYNGSLAARNGFLPSTWERW